MLIYKFEYPYKLDVKMCPEISSRCNELVGGEITKRLVKMGEQQLNKSNK